jgi:hypothetical protein
MWSLLIFFPDHQIKFCAHLRDLRELKEQSLYFLLSSDLNEDDGVPAQGRNDGSEKNSDDFNLSFCNKFLSLNPGLK